MDMNCEVTFDPRSMRRLKSERSAAAWGNGRYRFEDGTGTEGVIRMVKVVMVEGLPWDVEAYAARNPKFPRTSTGDQLYDEFDLEAYRILGREVVKKLIANPPKDEPAQTTPPVEKTAPVETTATTTPVTPIKLDTAQPVARQEGQLPARD
jgi:hypothetical protein